MRRAVQVGLSTDDIESAIEAARRVRRGSMERVDDLVERILHPTEEAEAA
jgi:hypothetical protein